MAEFERMDGEEAGGGELEIGKWGYDGNGGLTELE